MFRLLIRLLVHPRSRWLSLCIAAALLFACRVNVDAQNRIPQQRVPAAPSTQPPQSAAKKPPQQPVKAADSPTAPAAEEADTESTELDPTSVGFSEEPQITSERVQELGELVSSASDLEDAEKQRLAELIRAAGEQLQRVDTLSEKRAKSEKLFASAQQRSEAFDTALAEPLAPTTPPDSEVPLGTLEQQLSALEQEVKSLNEQFRTADKELTLRTERRKVAREQLAEAKHKLETLPGKLAETPSSATPLATQIDRAAIKSQQQMLQAQIPALEAELQLLDAEDALDLPRKQRDLKNRDKLAAESRLEALREIVQQQRAEIANEKKTAAQRMAKEELDPLLRSMRDRNVQLATENEAVVREMRRQELELGEAQTVLDNWRKLSETTRSKVKSIGLTDAIGSKLRNQKLSLPNVRLIRHEIRDRSSIISDAQFKLSELEEERSANLQMTLSRQYDVDSDRLMEGLLTQAKSILAERNELLTPLIRQQSNYFDTLVELSNTQQQTQQLLEDYEAFIDERILWVRSSKPLPAFRLSDLRSLKKPSTFDWTRLGKAIRDDALKTPSYYIVVCLLAIVMFGLRQRFRHRIKVSSEQASKQSCISYTPTLATFVTSVVMASAWPLLIGAVAWRMVQAQALDDQLRPIYNTIGMAALIYWPLSILSVMFRSGGLAQMHFGWSEATVYASRRAIRNLIWLALPLGVTYAFLSESGGPISHPLLARFVFLIAMGVFALIAYRLLHPVSGAFKGWLMHHPNSWGGRLWSFIWTAAVACPLIGGALSFFGYQYTAEALTRAVLDTNGILLTCLIATAMLARFLLVERRRISVEQARQRRAAMKLSESEGTTPIREELLSNEELHSQIAQSKRLVGAITTAVVVVAVWWVWSDILPALGFLEQWPLWRSTTEVTELVTADDGESRYVSRDIVDNVTIADLLMAILIGIATFVAMRNLPGALELSILKRLPIDSSIRYAITSIVSYLIALIGIVVAFGVLGVHWKQVQWLATALTFGLAFGLQEMFANFVAGIIILFERPIRVGDIVTVDDITGKVSRVQIRATTITNFDRKDYIVPNKDFITGRVLNWTLSDHINRIVIPVGIAYGSDTQLAIDLLTKVANDHPRIIDDPEPLATFEEFADSSLTMILRCFISMNDMPFRLNTVHELHMQIDKEFRKANIEIAFPQQDVHLRTIPNRMEVVDRQSNGAETSPYTHDEPKAVGDS